MNKWCDRKVWARKISHLKRLVELRCKIFKNLMVLKRRYPKMCEYLKLHQRQTRKLCSKKAVKAISQVKIEGENLARLAIMYGIWREKLETDEQLRARIKGVLYGYDK